MRPVLTIMEPEFFSESAKARLMDHYDVLWRPSPLWAMSEVLWVRLGKVELGRFGMLKAVACNCTDVSHLRLAECQRRGIEVLCLKGIEGLDTVHATAEHTIGLMLQALRHGCDRSSGKIGRELRGKKVLFLGHGRIAKQVRAILEGGFGASFGKLWKLSDEERWERMNQYDIVSIHASLNETSKGIVNAEFLAKLKPGCIVINTARHAIVDGRAILDWLERDSQAIYAHDFSDKWQPSKFVNVESFDMYGRIGTVTHPRIIGTPHIGGWTLESLHKTEELLAEKVIEWAKSRSEVPSGCT